MYVVFVHSSCSGTRVGHGLFQGYKYWSDHEGPEKFPVSHPSLSQATRPAPAGTATEGGDGPGQELSRDAGYVCTSCKRVFQSTACLRQHRWHYINRGTPCEDLASSAARKNIPTRHLATGLERLEPLFPPVPAGLRAPCVINRH